MELKGVWVLYSSSPSSATSSEQSSSSWVIGILLNHPLLRNAGSSLLINPQKAERREQSQTFVIRNAVRKASAWWWSWWRRRSCGSKQNHNFLRVATAINKIWIRQVQMSKPLCMLSPTIWFIQMYDELLGVLAFVLIVLVRDDIFRVTNQDWYDQSLRCNREFTTSF